MNWYVIDVEEMPEAIKSKSLKEAVRKAKLYLGIRKKQRS